MVALAATCSPGVTRYGPLGPYPGTSDELRNPAAPAPKGTASGEAMPEANPAAPTFGEGVGERIAHALAVSEADHARAVAIRDRLQAHVATVLADLRTWMAEREYDSVDQLRGSVSARGVGDPAAYVRANYLQALTSYSSTFPS